MKKIYILDGSGYLYRAYHALPPLANRDGININMIYGFFRMVLRLFQEKPDYLVIAWDSHVKTIRHDMFAEYKANRPSKPDDFKRQESKIKELVPELKINYLEAPTYEADDIIFTLVNKLKNTDLNIYIESLDKDLKQLLDDTTYLYNSTKGEIVDVASFKKEFGFAPALILDYLSLLGDASDNIPGVRGIGKKTAQNLVVQYGDLDSIYNNIDNISGAIKEKLIEGQGLAYKSKDLIRLMQVPGFENVKIDDYIQDFDFGLFKKILMEQCNFTSMEKVLVNLKKQYEGGEQLSLFG